MYARYRDDILVVVNSPKAGKEFLAELQKRASPCWRIELEFASLAGVSMLDVQIFKGVGFRKTGFLDFQTHIKPTARHVPLSPFSNHPMHTHRAWPVSEIRRVYQTCRYPRQFEHFRRLKVERFQKFGLAPAAIKRCEAWRPNHDLYRVGRESVRVFKVRIVVGWHPALKNLGGRLRAVCARWAPLIAAACGWRGDVSVEVAYKLAGAPLHAMLRKVSNAN